MSNNNNQMAVSSADIIRLIQAHLIETGLHETCRMLRQESGIGMAGVFHENWLRWCVEGRYGLILQSLATIDQARAHVDANLLAAVHEMAILELAEEGDLELAYALYRSVQSMLEDSISDEEKISRSRLITQKLAALASLRNKDPNATVPPHYYGKQTKQERREELGARLRDAIPVQPPNRLVALLQQAVKWQVYTGEHPRVRQWWEDDEDDMQPNKKKRRKQFDLVLGLSHVAPQLVGETSVALASEDIPSSPFSSIKFGKHATAEAALFLPDSLITGSSDGLIEIWDSHQNYKSLRLDLPYQQKEELLGHDDAISSLQVSNDGALLASASVDGQVKIWRIDNGNCLRSFQVNAVVADIAFSPDSSHLLLALNDGKVREFGLRAGRMLKESNAHKSYVNVCFYHVNNDRLVVVTGSADGTVKISDGKTLEVMKVFRPVSLGKVLSNEGSSILADRNFDCSADSGSPGIHTVILMYSPANTLLIVPRGIRAFLVDFDGTVLRIYEDNGQASGKASGNVFVAATVSSSNRLLYAVKDDGVCCVFDVQSGKLETTITKFGSESTKGRDDKPAEITGIFFHPSRRIVAAFSNDKTQTKGQLVLWK